MQRGGGGGGGGGGAGAKRTMQITHINDNESLSAQATFRVPCILSVTLCDIDLS